MSSVFFILELIGTVAFALSGALTAMKKKMDLLGTCVLGMTTAVGGGIIRDLIIGKNPPTAFISPLHSLVAIGVSIVAFLPFVQKIFVKKHTYDAILNVADAIGLGVFTIIGVNAGFTAIEDPNLFTVIFLGVITGVGGGVLRDVMAQTPPTIFVKYFYATASIIGALMCALVHINFDSELAGSIAGAVVVIALRILAMIFHWHLPKPKYSIEE